LHFSSAAERTTNIKKVENFLQSIGVNRIAQNRPTNLIYHDAETYDQRKKLLEKFFRTVTLQVIPYCPLPTSW
jgi:hypothetical protein